MTAPPLNRAVWTIAAVACATRLAAAVILDGFGRPHLEEYDVIARNLLAGAGYSYPYHGITYYSYVPPLLSWVSAASYWLTGNLIPLIMLQIAVGAATAVVAALVAYRLFGEVAAALASGLLVAVHPGLTVYAASRAHPLTLDAFMFSLVLLQTLRAADGRRTVSRLAVLGLIVGVGALSRATIAVFLPVALVWLIVSNSAQWKRMLAASAVAVLCATAVVAPWTLRNARMHGRLVAIVTLDSELFWRGNNPHATGGALIDATHDLYSTLAESERQELERLPTEVEQADWFRERSRAYIREQPAAFIRLTLLKFFYFWWYSPVTGVLYPGGWFLVSHAWYVLTVLLAASGIWRGITGGPSAASRVWLVAAFLIALSALQSLYYVEGRHRWAVEPMVIALSGGGAAVNARRFQWPDGRID